MKDLSEEERYINPYPWRRRNRRFHLGNLTWSHSFVAIVKLAYPYIYQSFDRWQHDWHQCWWCWSSLQKVGISLQTDKSTACYIESYRLRTFPRSNESYRNLPSIRHLLSWHTIIAKKLMSYCEGKMWKWAKHLLDWPNRVHQSNAGTNQMVQDPWWHQQASKTISTLRQTARKMMTSSYLVYLSSQ